MLLLTVALMTIIFIKKKIPIKHRYGHKKALKQYVKDMRATGAITTNNGFTADDLTSKHRQNFDHMKSNRDKKQYLELMEGQRDYAKRPRQSADSIAMN